MFGATQLQNMATLGGNVVNASPAGDSLPLMLAAEAVLVVGGPSGERAIPAASFFIGYRRTALQPGELLLRMEFPVGGGRQLRYRKIGTRRALALSKVALAVAWRQDPGSPAWRDVRVAVGTITEVPIRAPSAEAVAGGCRSLRRRGGPGRRGRSRGHPSARWPALDGRVPAVGHGARAPADGPGRGGAAGRVGGEQPARIS